MNQVPIKNFFIGKGAPLTIISGPCAIESEEHTLRSAEYLKKLMEKYKVNYIFKSSYDKANRSSHKSFRGPGLHKGLKILEKVQRELDLAVTTDVHSPDDATAAGQVCDLLQIPAFLCRQTDLIVAAAKTQKPVNIKKGQFMAPWDMGNAVSKVRNEGNPHVILTDRGVTFGYNNLVTDLRAIPIMQGFNVPVCFDATHSVQLPGGKGETSGGQREYIPLLAKAAVAAGVNALFMEAHDDPKNALSDASSVLDFKDLPELLDTLVKLYAVINDK